MKVLLFSDLWLPFPGGAERYVYNMAKELMRRGHEVVALTSYDRAETPDVAVIVEDIGVTSNNRHGQGADILRSVVAKVQPEAIVTHHFFAFEFEQELLESGIPIVQLIYNRHRMPGVAFAVFISQYVWDHSGGKQGDVLLHPPAYEDIVADTHGEKIGFIKPIHHKGVDYVYRLAEYFPQRQFLILRGEWPDSEDIRSMPNVEFMASVKDMREFYRHCKVILMPSWNEDAGTVAQEAAINGLPCISTDVMGLHETNGGGIRLERNETFWREELDRLFTDQAYYDQIVGRQFNYLKTFQWSQKFDLISAKLEATRR